MKKSTSKFFDKYKNNCEEFNRGPVHIPKSDPKNGIEGKNITLMFINERPGRIGPGKSDLISFENLDPTAYRFRRLFETLGVNRKNIFITNACIYYPLRKNYKDAPLTTNELNFSASILEDQIKRINPKILVPMGNTALRTLKKFTPELQHVKLQTHVGKVIKGTKMIFPLYHTSNRAAVTRKEEKQRKDWTQLKKIISSLD